jgi:hypothetical protein
MELNIIKEISIKEIIILIIEKILNMLKIIDNKEEIFYYKELKKMKEEIEKDEWNKINDEEEIEIEKKLKKRIIIKRKIEINNILNEINNIITKIDMKVNKNGILWILLSKDFKKLEIQGDFLKEKFKDNESIKYILSILIVMSTGCTNRKNYNKFWEKFYNNEIEINIEYNENAEYLLKNNLERLYYKKFIKEEKEKKEAKIMEIMYDKDYYKKKIVRIEDIIKNKNKIINLTIEKQNILQIIKEEKNKKKRNWYEINKNKDRIEEINKETKERKEKIEIEKEKEYYNDWNIKINEENKNIKNFIRRINEEYEKIEKKFEIEENKLDLKNFITIELKMYEEIKEIYEMNNEEIIKKNIRKFIRILNLITKKEEKEIRDMNITELREKIKEINKIDKEKIIKEEYMKKKNEKRKRKQKIITKSYKKRNWKGEIFRIIKY